jgi:hypothetical protein
MKRALHISLLALGASLAIAGSARATVISGSATFKDDGPAGNGLIFSGTADNGALSSLNLTLDTPVTLTNFLTITSNDTNDAFFGKAGAKDNLETDFAFTLPSGGSGTLAGKGKETTDAFFGFIFSTTGAVTWANPAAIDFADGAVLDVSLSTARFNPDGGPDQTVHSSLTLDLIAPPSAVPEPAAFMVLATGLLGLTMVQRRRGRRS